MSDSHTPKIPDDARALYLKRRVDDLHRCTSALQASDFATLETIGHRLKGNGVTFGYPELSVIGAEIEAWALNKKGEELSTTLKRLSDWVSANSAELGT